MGIFKFTDEKLIELWKQGLTDLEIAQRLKASIITVGNRRRALKLEVHKKKRQDKFDVSKERLEELCKTLGTDSAVANALGTSYQIVQRLRKKYNIPIANYHQNLKIELTQIQREMIFGTLLGDGYCKKTKDDRTAEFSFNHSIKQKEYVEWKYKFLENFPGRMYEFTRSPHYRTGKVYGTFTGKFDTNPSFDEFRDMFYDENSKKHIPIKYLDELYTPLAMAIHYMDDGSCTVAKYGDTIKIATCCFEDSEIDALCNFMLRKYKIECYRAYGKNLQIRAKSVPTFMELIEPYIIPSMTYKLSPKWVKKRNSENSDNSLPSLDLNDQERSND